MKTILLSYKGFENNAIFNGEDMNNSKGPWKLLKKKLAELGYDFKTVDTSDLTQANRILFVDEVSLGAKKKKSSALRMLVKKILRRESTATPQRETYAEGIALGLRNKMTLLLWEPSSVDPDNYTEETYKKFNTIITWNDDIVDNKKFFKFDHPYPEKEHPPLSVPFKDKKMLVNISMNKHSHEPNELYSMRRKSIRFFERALGEQFDLFGYGWNKPTTKYETIFPFLTKQYPRYKGMCADKHTVLSEYKFSLCYENVKKHNGLVSEKIFDCFHAKTVPIYWGPDNITDYIPEEAFIDRRRFDTDAAVLYFLKTLTEEDHAGYVRAIEDFLQSEKYKVFSPEHFADTVIKNLNLEINA